VLSITNYHLVPNKTNDWNFTTQHDERKALGENRISSSENSDVNESLPTCLIPYRARAEKAEYGERNGAKTRFADTGEHSLGIYPTSG
jgi:hypothetical protein